MDFEQWLKFEGKYSVAIKNCEDGYHFFEQWVGETKPSNEEMLMIKAGELKSSMERLQGADKYEQALNDLSQSAIQAPASSVVGTTLTIINTTPMDLWLSAKIHSTDDWGSVINRPDINITCTKDTPTLTGFKRVILTEDIAGTAKTARYTVTLSLTAQDDTPEDKRFTFEVDQADSKSGQPTESSAKFLEVKGPVEKEWAVSQVGESKVGSTRGLTLYLLTPRGE